MSSVGDWSEEERKALFEEIKKELSQEVDREAARAYYYAGDIDSYVACVSWPGYVPDERDREIMTKLGFFGEVEYVIIRQDDNGNQFVMEKFKNKWKAHERLLEIRRISGERHKQIFWVDIRVKEEE